MAVTLAEVEGLALPGRPRACAALYPAVKAILDEGVVLRPPDLRIVPALAGLAAGLAGDLASSDLYFETPGAWSQPCRSHARPTSTSCSRSCRETTRSWPGPVAAMERSGSDPPGAGRGGEK